MFMEKIDLPRVTCDLFGATKGFDGSGCGSDKPRAANDAEARAYADFIRRKAGLPDLGSAQMERRPYPNSRGEFYYVGATFGQVLSGDGWEGEGRDREYVPAQYEAGAFSVLFPGANMMRAKVTLETLDEAGAVVISQTMPVEPKKGGVVWSRDDVRKACGPVAKVKAARKAPTVAKRRAAPIAAERGKRSDAERRAILRAWQMRADMRRMRAKPEAVPAEVMADIAEAERLIRCEGYVAPAPTAIQASKRTPAHERAIRRAWAERKARREAEAYWESSYAEAKAEHWQAVSDCHRAQAKRRRAVLKLREMQGRAAHYRANWKEEARRCGIAEDRARLAEQIAEDHLRMREDLQRLLRAAEARAEAAEAENAQLWAEIETLTAPAAALAA